VRIIFSAKEREKKIKFSTRMQEVGSVEGGAFASVIYILAFTFICKFFGQQKA
jgi:hypothetical protein